MSAVTMNEVSAMAESDSIFWYVAGTAKTARKHLRLVQLIVVLPPLAVASFAIAQAFPAKALKLVRGLNQVLPNCKSSSDLAFARDILHLARAAGNYYKRLCVWNRAKMTESLEEIEEMIESIDFVLENREQLEQFVKSAELARSPELPLPLGEAVA